VRGRDRLMTITTITITITIARISSDRQLVAGQADTRSLSKGEPR
jgi:hypothetical protein